MDTKGAIPMQITDAISITELSRLAQKSRPTIYKYIQDFESGNESAVPYVFLELFQRIQEEDISMEEIREYCSLRFGNPEEELTPECKDFIEILKKNQNRIDFPKLERLLRKAMF